MNNMNRFLTEYLGPDWEWTIEKGVYFGFLALVALMEAVCWLCPLA